MRYIVIALFIFIIMACVSLHAEEKNAKGLEMVPETAATVVNKALAFLSGDLVFTMPEDKDKYKDKDNYTTNAIGQKVPKSSVVK